MALMEPAVAMFRTHQEAEAATLAYYRRLKPAERLEILFQLRDFARKEDDASSDKGPRHLRRAVATKWRAVIESLNSSGVEYLIVGAVALAQHGLPRYTGDLDILVRNRSENARRLEGALQTFGFGDLGLKAADFIDSYQVVQLGLPPNRIDLMTSITGVSFEEAWAQRVETVLEGMHVSFIGRQTLIQNKKATGRPQDLADLAALGEGSDNK
jgi:hypothetical protein